jgi:hypothetical protein
MIIRKLAALAFVASSTVALADSPSTPPQPRGYDCSVPCHPADPFCWFWQKMSCPPTIPGDIISPDHEMTGKLEG